MGDTRESLEVRIRSLLDFFVSHVPIMAHFSLLQEVYCLRFDLLHGCSINRFFSVFDNPHRTLYDLDMFG